jgi:penicillin-binding protein 2
MDMHDAIVRSCDVYYYQLATIIGIDDIASGLKAFGFGSVTGLDIEGEKAGILPSPDWKRKRFARREDQTWYLGETVNTGVGQGYMLVTPLQLAHAEATMAARGERHPPRFLIGVEDGTTRAVKYFDPESLTPVAHNAEHWDFVR